jgi:hypothetical protein
MMNLNLTPPYWFEGLAAACQDLRQLWPQAWPGLPAIAQLCSRSLALEEASEPEVVAMRRFTLAVAQDLEAQARQRPSGQEPRYHNRLHTADVMLTATTLLHAQQATAGALARPWAAATLAAATAHDFGHPGGVNREPFEFEAQSWAALARHAQGLPRAWCERIESLILHTDPRVVADNHRKVADQPFAWSLPWCQVLLNEADILVSASARFGPALSQALAQEWERAGVPAHASVATPAGRALFLRSVQFSSPAAQAMGMSTQIQQQLP